MIRYIYRDTQTGQFAKKETWKRSKAQGGKRYKRERVRKKRKRFPPPPPPPPPPPGEPVYEWIVSFTYRESGRSFDVIVTARTEEEAYKVSQGFLLDDTQGRKIVQQNYVGWARRAARGIQTDEPSGLGEYRDQSRA